jgi:hypothetical protein
LGALYPDNSRVFGANAMRLLLQDNRGPEMAVATGIEYELSLPQLGPLFIAQSNSILNLTWTGPGILQSSPSLTAGMWANVTNANGNYRLPAGAGSQFFRLVQ